MIVCLIIIYSGTVIFNVITVNKKLTLWLPRIRLFLRQAPLP